MPARDYQIMAAQSLWDYFSKNDGNPLILMPTATGKSHVIAIFCESVLRHYPHQRIQVLTHVKELIQQNYNKFVEAWPTAPAGVYSAGLNRRDIHNSIVFAGIASVAKKATLFGHIDLVVVDEAHLVNPTEETMYNNYFAALKQVNPRLKVIGLTATGFRLGHGMIHEGGVFTDVCFDMTGVQAFNWLIEQGYLSPLIPKPSKLELDVSGVHMRGGEYIQGELQNAVDKKDITIKALQEALVQGAHRFKWLIFASGVDHAIHISQELTALGVPCGVVHSRMSGAERDKVLLDHRSGRIRAIANNNILTTGYDDTSIDFIVCLRPTASAVLWVQMMGRGTRAHFAPGYDLSTQTGRLAAIAASQKQNCLVLDYAGNTRRLGPINDPVIPHKKGEKAGTAPVKLCETCDTYNHASVRFCTCCGTEFVFAVKIKQQASTAALIKDVVLPETAIFQVNQITYQRYERPGKPPMVRVSYYCGLRKFDEYVCIEHLNFAGKKARDWWRKRSIIGPPDTTDTLLQWADKLRVPTHIRVWVNKPYPEIMDVDFSGTGWGTQPELSEIALPEVNVLSSKNYAISQNSYRVPDITTSHPITTVDSYTDDDIPF